MEDQKNELARKAEQAERLADEKRRQAEERERYKLQSNLPRNSNGRLMKLKAEPSALWPLAALAPQSRHVASHATGGVGYGRESANPAVEA